ncbi:response regulator [Streptomyces sp. NPDC091281]|uniref:response regulator n=1 Tax=Streptomyces sp. NPDC091281 TaxID=3365985 RepID=UPI00380C6EC1
MTPDPSPSPSPSPSPPTPVRVLVCDDHAVVRAGLLALLGSAPGIEVVAEAGSGEEALALARRLAPDVALMDLQLGDGSDGVETTRRLRALTPAPYVLVLTTYDTDADVTRAVEAGATGYLLKAERPEDLFTAIHAAAAGRPSLSPPLAARVLTHLRTPRPTLTPREHDILTQLTRGLANRDIARALYISETTVKTHLRRIYDKLGVDTRSGAVALAKEQRLV